MHGWMAFLLNFSPGKFYPMLQRELGRGRGRVNDLAPKVAAQTLLEAESGSRVYETPYSL